MKIIRERLNRVLVLLGMLALLVLASSFNLAAQEIDPHVRDGVREAAAEDGRVRVIINLRLPDRLANALETPGAQMTDSELGRAVADAQNSVLDTLEPGRNRNAPFLSSKFELVRQYDLVPALAGYLSPQGISALENNPRIESIQLDEMGTGGLAQAREIVDANFVFPDFGVNGEGRRVAFVDSGIDLAHPFLSDDIFKYGDGTIPMICFTQGDCRTATNPGAGLNTSAYANDENGHGTATSGIVTSSSAAHTGVAPNVQVVPVRVLNYKNEGYVSDWVAGLDWLINNNGLLNLDAVSISIQTGATYSANCDAVYPAMAAAVNNLVNEKNVAVISITGNLGKVNAITAPGCLSNAIAVGATYDYNGAFSGTGCADTAVIDKVTCFSDGGSLVSLVAPGAYITAPNFSNDANSDWAGTSAAAPMVSGAIAMMRQLAQQKGINLTPAQSLSILRQTGRPVTDGRNGLTYTRMNIAAALDYIDPISTISPAANDVIIEGNPIFSFTDRSYSTHYRVEVKNTTSNITTTSPWVERESLTCDGTTCSGRMGVPVADGNNIWRARTYFNGVTPGAWSAYSGNFSADGPILSTPDGTVSTALPTFTWAEITGAIWYQLFIQAKNGDFSYKQWYEVGTDITCAGTCTVTPDDFDALLTNQNYWWFVRPWMDTAAYGVWGGPKNFTVNVTAAPATPTIGPTTDINLRRPTFNWTVNTGIDSGGYWMNVRVRTLTGVVVQSDWYPRPDVCGTLTGTTCSVSASADLGNNTAYQVDVRAWGSGGMGGYSSVASFTVSVAAPDTPTGLNVIVNRGDPGFTWTYDSKALWYHLVVTSASDGSTLLDKWYEVGETVSCPITTCAVVPDLYLTNGTYNWTLESWGKGGFSVSSASGTPITLNYAPTSSITVENTMTTMTLETHTQVSRLTYVWPDVFLEPTPVDNEASWYQLVVRDPGGKEIHNAWYRRRENDCDGTTCQISPPLYLNNGSSYEWQVRGWGPGGMGAWGATAVFTVAADAQTTAPDVTAATPTGTIATNYPTFAWPTRSGTTWVHLQVWRTLDFMVMYDNWLDVQNLGCAGGTGTCTADQVALGGLVLNDTTSFSYAYRIRFYGPAGISPWSTIKNFTVDGPAAGTVTVINSPTDGTLVFDQNVTFSWEAATDTTWYRIQLTEAYTGDIIEYWFTAEALGCEGGGTCSNTLTIQPSRYNWTIANWGPGTPGTNFPETAPLELVVLE